MSARSFRRDRQRASEREARRLSTCSKVAIAAGAGFGATVLFATGAQAATFTVTKTTDDGSDGTLRKEIRDANIAPGDDTVVFASGLTGTITLSGALGGPVGIYDDGLDIQGPGASQLAVSGDDLYRIFDIYGFDADDEQVRISALTLTHAFTVGSGAVARNSNGASGYAADLTIADAALTHNQATVSGGALYDIYGALTIQNTQLTDNFAGSDGGAIITRFASRDGSPNPGVTISGSVLSGNEADAGNGGGARLYASYADVLIDSTTISGNHADDHGGGVSVDEGRGDVTIQASRISGNSAATNVGGADVYGNDGALTIRDSTFDANTTNGAGGGVGTYGNIGAELITGSTFSSNRADDGGGGLMVFAMYSDASVTVESSTLSGNRADADGDGFGDGGALYSVNRDNSGTVHGDGPRTIHNSTIVGNAAAEGGGVYAYFYDEPVGGPDTLSISSTIVANNSASIEENDLGENDPMGGATGSFELGFDLIEDLSGTEAFTQSPAGSNITGQDPDLGPLGANGGLTQTLLPNLTSPALDAGVANGLSTDQRGLARTSDLQLVPNKNGSDGTDIGSTEIEAADVEADCQGVVVRRLAGTDAGDTITGTDNPEAIFGAAGDDTLQGLGANDCLNGEAGNDSADGGEGNDLVDGGEGNDSLAGAGGKDQLTGQAGKDKLNGGPGKDKLTGAAGKDKLKGAGGKDKLTGGAGKDKLNPGKGKDKVKANGGKDKLTTADGKKDKLNCGGGKDKATVDAKDKVAANCETVKVKG